LRFIARTSAQILNKKKPALSLLCCCTQRYLEPSNDAKRKLVRCSMAWRRGRRLIKVVSKRGLDTMAQVGWCKQVIDQDKPDRMFIDVGGGGVGIHDRLVEMDYGEVARPINFGSAPMKSKEWLEDVGGVQRFPIAIVCRPTLVDPATSTTATADCSLRARMPCELVGCRVPMNGTRSR